MLPSQGQTKGQTQASAYLHTPSEQPATEKMQDNSTSLPDAKPRNLKNSDFQRVGKRGGIGGSLEYLTRPSFECSATSYGFLPTYTEAEDKGSFLSPSPAHSGVAAPPTPRAGGRARVPRQQRALAPQGSAGAASLRAPGWFPPGRRRRLCHSRGVQDAGSTPQMPAGRTNVQKTRPRRLPQPLIERRRSHMPGRSSDILGPPHLTLR